MNLYREAFTHIRAYPKAFWVLIGATLINQIGNMAMVFLLIYLVNGLKFSLAQASFIFALFGISTILSNLFCGSLINWFGAMKLLPRLLGLNGLILLIFPLCKTALLISLATFFWGSFFGLFRPVSQTLVSELSPQKQHKLTFSLFRLVVNLGMSIGPAIGGYLAYHSFAAIFIANGIANLLASFWMLIGFSKTSFQPKPITKEPFGLDIKWLRHDARLTWFLVGLLPVSMIFFQHESTLAIFLDQDLHFPLSFYGWLFTLNTLLIVFFELALNIATSHWPYRTNFLVGVFCITCGFVGLLWASMKWHVVLLAIFWTLGEMIFYPAATSYIAEIASPDRRGSYLSLFSVSSNLAMLFGPWGGALIMHAFGVNAVWIACAGLGVISLIIFYRHVKPHQP